MDRRSWLLVLLTVVVAVILYGVYISSQPVKRPSSVSPTPKSRPNVSGTRTLILNKKPSAVSRSSNLNLSDHVSQSKFGYVLASSYFDQLTGSMANFISMQCWAATLGRRVRVVEPFLVHSTYGVNFSDVVGNGYVHVSQDRAKLSDLFNMTEWMKMTSSFSPLISWNFFLRDAPRKLIVVDRECIQRDNPLQKCNDCVHLLDSLKFGQSVVAFARKYGFAIVRNICIPATFTTARKFRSVIYGPYNPRDVVVIFESWGGVQQNEYSIRVGISDLQRCNRMGFYWYMPVSSKIVEDGKKYVQIYMPEARYIAVMVRIQYIAILYNNFVGLPKEEIVYFLRRCFSNVLSKVNEMKTREKAVSVFLTLDSGKQGSYYFQESTEIGNILDDSANILYQMLFGDSSTLMEWNKSFDTIAAFQNPGYVATLQRYLAAKSSCLLTVGTGSFQFVAQTMYRTYHSDYSGTYCMDNIENCGSMF